jgi:pilus assembly protein CpaB
MIQRRTLWAVAAGLAFAGLAFSLLHLKAVEVARRSTPIDVLVANRYIPSHTSVRADWVTRRSIPEAYVGPGALTDLRQVEGLVTLAPLSSGEQIQANKFGRSGVALSGALEPGRRAFTLPLDEAGGVGGLLQPGDRVDLLMKGELGGRECAGFLFQDLRILAVGGRVRPSGTAPEETASSVAEEGYTHVTLSVSPDQAETLFYLENRSALRLVLRGEGDGETLRLPPMTESDFRRRWMRSLGGGAIE